MKKHLLSTLVLYGAASLFLTTSVLAQGVIFRFNDRVEQPVVTDGCGVDGSGEIVDGIATYHISGQVVEDGNGILHFISHENSHFSGTGTESGISYVGNYAGNVSERFNSLPYVYSEIFNLHLSGQGAIGDSYAKVRIKVTVNANGEVVVDIFDIELSDCGV